MDWAELAYQSGYFGLFVISFLASSLLPLASEIFVLAMPPLGYNLWLIGIVATAGNFLGSSLNYYIGLRGADFVLGRYVKIDPKSWQRAENFYQRWGSVALFFSWVPFIGDPLTVVAGAFQIHWQTFTFWVLLGKSLRYLVLLGLADRIFALFA